MKQFAVLYLFMLLLAATSHAQYNTNENKIWAFGLQQGLNFNSGTPVPFASGMNAGMTTLEGCASVCDTAGQVLFYSSGKKVYNKTGALMPNGASLVSFSTSSTEQAALIVPVIGTTQKYYLFSLGSIGNGRLQYCIVDMSLDGGLGDVVASSIGTPLADSLGENMIAVAGYSSNIWLVTHRADTSLFLSYNITAAGIGSPIVSATGLFSGPLCYSWSMLRVSPDRTRIAQAIYKAADVYGTHLYNFNAANGKVTNCMVIDSVDDKTYSVEFSPDSKKLYTSGNRKMAQFDISLAGASAIQASKYIVTDSTAGYDVRLGPDGKIYFRGRDNRDLNCIATPNLAGAACAPTLHAVVMPNRAHDVFPNVYVRVGVKNESAGEPIVSATAAAISAYPNPAGSVLTIASPYNINSVVIIDRAGRVVYEAPAIGKEVRADVSGLIPGTYTLRVNHTETLNFIKL
ncbi:MAG: T9SS type A sorting domain-containing protein [Bacteroidota bacterium]